MKDEREKLYKEISKLTKVAESEAQLVDKVIKEIKVKLKISLNE